MKATDKILSLILIIGIIFSCSKNDSNSDDSEIVKEDYIVRYENEPNVDNQLLAETYIKDNDAKTFIFGSTDLNGDILSVESLAFKETNSDDVYYFILDNFQRVTQIYSEANGVKNAEVQYFYYKEPGLINYVVAERNWITNEENVVHFSTVEIDGENYNFNTLFGKSTKVKGVFWDSIISNLIVVGVVAAAAITIVAVAKGVSAVSALTAGVLFTGAVFASETPVSNVNPNAPNPPDKTLIENPCVNSTLSVIIGVDPGNELYAIVNGDSDYYDFYWSTGQTDIGIITSHITAPDNGTYYVMVKDEKGCVAFAATNPIIEPIAWYKGSYTLGHVGQQTDQYYNCGTQYGQTGEFYVYIAKLGSETKVAVYSKSIIADLPNIYTGATFDPLARSSINNSFIYYTRIRPLRWRDTYEYSFNPSTSSNIFYRGFEMTTLKLNEDTNSLEADSNGYLSMGMAFKNVEPTVDNLEYGTFDINGNHLYSLEYIYYFTDVSANFVCVLPPEEITDYELANMEMILFDNDIFRFSSVD